MEFILVRHGKTEYNERRQYCGALDPDLSDLGRQELEHSAIKTYLEERTPDMVFCSPMQRTLQTAAILLDGRDVPLVAVPELREIDFGDFEGRSYEDMKDDPAYTAWLDTNCEGPIPGGDFPDAFRDDVEVCFESLLETCRTERVERALVVSHGGVLGTILERFAEPEKHWYEYHFPCGGFAVLKDGHIETLGGDTTC
ncbi:MAG: histidine phosphatase family protein [Eubacteriales bacterium]|nr:histidine phosphatase family protein [Eubacteriales bacterium]